MNSSTRTSFRRLSNIKPIDSITTVSNLCGFLQDSVLQISALLNLQKELLGIEYETEEHKWIAPIIIALALVVANRPLHVKQDRLSQSINRPPISDAEAKEIDIPIADKIRLLFHVISHALEGMGAGVLLTFILPASLITSPIRTISGIGGSLFGAISSMAPTRTLYQAVRTLAWDDSKSSSSSSSSSAPSSSSTLDSHLLEETELSSLEEGKRNTR
jgi:hypothetical protein